VGGIRWRAPTGPRLLPLDVGHRVATGRDDRLPDPLGEAALGSAWLVDQLVRETL